MITQPSNTILNTKNIFAGIEWSPTIAERANYALQMAQKAIDSDTLMFVMKHTPQATGTLRDSALLQTIIGSGEVRQSTPYAREVHDIKQVVNLAINPFARPKWMPYVESTYRDIILNHGQEVLEREFKEG